MSTYRLWVTGSHYADKLEYLLISFLRLPAMTGIQHKSTEF